MNLKDFKLVVGVSGGPDSMYLLNKIINEKNYTDIIVCHVNYNFREDSNYDQKVVENFCNKHKIKFKIKSIKFTSGNFEEWARVQRYDFFVEVIKKFKFDKIVIAHNLNDHIETFVMQTLRNSIVDYYGINAIGEYDGIEVVRPIIDLKKTFILSELEKEKIVYAIDSTNDDEAFLRNRIRKTLDEDELDRVREQARLQNKIIVKFKNKYEELYKKPTFNLTVFDEMNENEINRFVFCWIKENDKTRSVLKKKKKFIKEVVKQLQSPKSLEIVTDNIKITKVKNYVTITMIG